MSDENNTRRDFMKQLGMTAANLTLVNQLSLAEGDENGNPNILWINCEDIGPALGCYGDDFATTPNLDQLAREGILYRNAFATAPICAPARSCLITGVYATSLGTQHLRSEVTIPDFIKTVPHYLREQGYFCTIKGKTDYNFSPDGVWDYWRNDMAPWRKRQDNQPFFSMFSIGNTHEGPTNFPDRYEKAIQTLPKDLLHDPDEVPLPPFYPDTPDIRTIWAHVYDLITEMDRQVGSIIQNLKDDGLYDQTIIFFFADHGFGLPRYKRWLNDSGLRVPFIVRIPAKYQHLANTPAGEEVDELVSFVDFAPTTLNLAGAPIPKHMQGQRFLGKNKDKPRDYVFGARSRADDMFEVSRSVQNDSYIYIRHYMPHLPYIQPGEIMSDIKWSYRELRRLRNEGKLKPEAELMWQETKPIEELYDLKNDPHEICNLADSPSHQTIKENLHARLHEWILDHRDTGFLQEAEMHIRAQGSTIYEMAQDPSQYNLSRILETAGMVDPYHGDIEALTKRLNDPDSGVRYWAATGLLALAKKASPAIPHLIKTLDDPSPSVRIVSAEALCHLDHEKKALPVLKQCVQDNRVWVALHAARTLLMIGKKACPLKKTVIQVLEANKGPAAGGRYKDFNYAAFTSWSLEWVMKNCS